MRGLLKVLDEVKQAMSNWNCIINCVGCCIWIQGRC